MEPFRAVQAVLASNFRSCVRVMPKATAAHNRLTKRSVFANMFPHLPAGTPKAPGTSSQDRQYYLGSRQPPVSSETLMHSADQEA
jgi:hypothetical protein